MQHSNGDNQQNIPIEKRSEPRSAKLRNYRIEIKFVGMPVYQFKVRDVSSKGAGVIVRDDSEFLAMIEVGQVLEVNLISPRGSKPSGFYRARIKQISKLERGRYKGHRLVGISIMEKL
jgi:hypothetical protein